MSDGHADERQDTDGDEGQLDNEDRESLNEFLAQFSGNGIQYIVKRLEPKTFAVRGQTRKVNGHLETLTSPPSAEEIRDGWGGGVYEVRVMGPKPGQRGIRFYASKRIEIAGDPKLKAETLAEGAPPTVEQPAADSSSLYNRILDVSMEDRRRLEERLDQERQRSEERLRSEERQRSEERVRAQAAPQPELLEKTLGAIERSQKDQLDTLREQLTRRDHELSELRQHQQSARSPFENPEVLKVLFGRGAEDSSRLSDGHRRDLEIERERFLRELAVERDRYTRDVATERERHGREVQLDRERRDQELATERERRDQELATERERRQMELEAQRRDHDNAIALLERLHRSDLENLRTASAQLVATKEDTIARLGEEVRALRDSSRPSDTLTDLQRMGQVLATARGLAGGTTEPAEPQSGWEKLLSAAQPILEGLLRPATQPAALPAMQPIARLPPRLAVVRAPAQPAAGRIPLPNPAQAPQASPPAPQSPPASVAPTAAPSPPATAVPPLGGPEMQQGLEFLETAFRNGRSVEEVARSVMSLFGKNDLAVFVEAGPEALVSQIEQLRPDSLLAAPGGRRFLRELLETLGRSFGGE